MRNLWIAIATIFLCLAAYGGEAGSDNRLRTLSELETQKKQLAEEMLVQRAKLIKSDVELAALHSRIMALHKELALKLDGKKEMQSLSAKMRKLDETIEKLHNKKEISVK